MGERSDLMGLDSDLFGLKKYPSSNLNGDVIELPLRDESKILNNILLSVHPLRSSAETTEQSLQESQ